MLVAPVFDTELVKLSSRLWYQTLYETAPVIADQPNVIELLDFEVILACGPGHVTGLIGVFENPEVAGARSVKIKNTLRIGCKPIFKHFFIIKKLKVKGIMNCCTACPSWCFVLSPLRKGNRVAVSSRLKGPEKLNRNHT